MGKNKFSYQTSLQQSNSKFWEFRDRWTMLFHRGRVGLARSLFLKSLVFSFSCAGNILVIAHPPPTPQKYRGYYRAARRYQISLRELKNISRVSAHLWTSEIFFNIRREISYLQASDHVISFYYIKSTSAWECSKILRADWSKVISHVWIKTISADLLPLGIPLNLI